MDDSLILVLGLIFGVLSATWVYSDGKARGSDATFWAFISFLIPLLGVPGYLLSRPSTPSHIVVNTASGGRVCRECDILNSEDSGFCKSCGAKLASGPRRAG